MEQQKKAMMDGMLEHSAKGTTWKKHKYIGKKNGKYIYPSKKALATKSKITVKDVTDDNIHQIEGWAKDYSKMPTIKTASKTGDSGTYDVAENLMYDLTVVKSYGRQGANGMPSNVQKILFDRKMDEIDTFERDCFESIQTGKEISNEIKKHRYYGRPLRRENGKITR